MLYLMISVTVQVRYYHIHFIYEKLEARRNEITDPARSPWVQSS